MTDDELSAIVRLFEEAKDDIKNCPYDALGPDHFHAAMSLLAEVRRLRSSHEEKARRILDLTSHVYGDQRWGDDHPIDTDENLVREAVEILSGDPARST